MTTGAGPTRPASNALLPGQRAGRYEVVCRLASGGMAELYLARAHGVGGFEKDVVLKRILPHIAEDAAFVDLFLHEARLAAAINHPNVAAVYDVGEAEGLPFFAMEYVHGEDLGHVLQELSRRNQRLPLGHAVAVLCGVAAGLHAAHETRGPDGQPLGIVHRDVSPANVLVTFSGGVKLIDFGIAKATLRDGHSAVGGALRGKIPYMSPEQCTGKRLDRRSDLFSLGVLLFELTTGSRPFEGDSGVATLRKIVEAPAPAPGALVPGYPRALAAIVDKALRKPVDERYQTARELGAALEAFAHDDGLSLSAVALADFMERSFGPKPAPSARAARVNRTAEFGPVPAPPSQPSVKVVAPPAARKSHRALLVGGAFALLAAGALVGRALVSPKPRAPEAPVVIVAERGRVAVEPAAPPPPVTPPPPAIEPPPAPVASEPAKPRGRRSPAAAVGRQQRALERCYLRHAAGANAARLSVQFRADRRGRVESATLTPAEAANTPLGACVLAVARKVRFGPQPAPLAFTIPLRFNMAGPRR